MTIYNLKTKFQNFLRPAAEALHSWGITPNQITVFTCVLSLGYAICWILFADCIAIYLFFPVLFFIRMALNAIDGMIANEHNKKTQLGAVLNEICDVSADFFLAFALLFVAQVNVHLLWGFIYMSLLAEAARAWSFAVSGKHSHAGPLGKSDRGVVLISLAYLVAWEAWHRVDLRGPIEIILELAIVLLGLTVFNRLKFSLKEK